MCRPPTTTRLTTRAVLIVRPVFVSSSQSTDWTLDRFLEVLLQKGAHRLAYIFMDASSDMWIYTCDKVIGKDGPTETLLDRIINDAGFRQMLKSPHLQTETCKYSEQSIYSSNLTFHEVRFRCTSLITRGRAKSLKRMSPLIRRTRISCERFAMRYVPFYLPISVFDPQ